MRIDWRALLSEIRVDWRDRGANCTSGNVNIACPWCGNDPSFHLSIAEELEAFYCYRNPDHAGRSFLALLVRLRQQRAEAVRLLNEYMRSSAPKAAARPMLVDSNKAWSRFTPASQSKACLRYLEDRGFDAQDAVARFDLRVAADSRWGWRLLIPYKDAGGSTLTWTGRALRPDMTPKYLAQTLEANSPAFVPVYPQVGKEVLVLVEGPIDALRVAVAAEGTPFVVAALAGKGLTSSKLLQLRGISHSMEGVFVALDADVSINAAARYVKELAANLRVQHVVQARLPAGRKDPAEMGNHEVRQWLIEHRSRLRPAG